MKLWPCPFCGGKAVIERIGTQRQSQLYACVECGCHLETGETGGSVCRWNTRTDEWRDISTAPDDCQHIRGLWVRYKPTGKLSWRQYMGVIDDETGEFVDELGQDFGWAPEDYEKWHPQPLPPPTEEQ